MDWLFELQRTSPTAAHAIAIPALVCVAGMSLGSVQVRGIKLGTAGVLFAAILTEHFGKPIDRARFAKDFVELSGLLAGSMTDPPALAFANGFCHCEAPAVAYAAVYPLTMLLRIIVAQFLAVMLCG